MPDSVIKYIEEKKKDYTLRDLCIIRKAQATMAFAIAGIAIGATAVATGGATVAMTGGEGFGRVASSPQEGQSMLGGRFINIPMSSNSP